MHIKQLDCIRLPVINRLYKQFYAAGKAKADETIWVMEQHQQIVAVVRFKALGQVQLLTGMLVIPAMRGQGIATMMLQKLQQQYQQMPCYCFAFKHLQSLYQTNGFAIVELEQLPPELKSRFLRYNSPKKALIPMIFRGLCETASSELASRD